MSTHELKVWTAYFDALASGDKPFEVRRDDRGFQRGDLLRLREWDRSLGVVDAHRYTGREVTRRISYVLTGGQFGIEPGFVVLGLGGVRAADTAPRARGIQAGIVAAVTRLGRASPPEVTRALIAAGIPAKRESVGPLLSRMAARGVVRGHGDGTYGPPPNSEPRP